MCVRTSTIHIILCMGNRVCTTFVGIHVFGWVLRPFLPRRAGERETHLARKGEQNRDVARCVWTHVDFSSCHARKKPGQPYTQHTHAQIHNTHMQTKHQQITTHTHSQHTHAHITQTLNTNNAHTTHICTQIN